MIVCEHCLEAIESHEGNQIKRRLDYDDDKYIVYGYYDDDGNFIKEEDAEDNFEKIEAYVVCEWCEEETHLYECFEI